MKISKVLIIISRKSGVDKSNHIYIYIGKWISLGETYRQAILLDRKQTLVSGSMFYFN
jgi:hypothetical protein